MLRWSPYVLAKFGEVGSMHSLESSVSCAPPPKISRENVLNRQTVDYSLLLNFFTEFQRMTHEVL